MRLGRRCAALAFWHGRYRVVLILLFCAVSVACSAQRGTVRTLQVGPASFRTEIVATPEARQRGLMGRTDLNDGMAMLFVFPDEQPRMFWMKETPTALSLAYIDRRGVIRQILPMQPYSLELVPSRYPAMYGLEVNRGAFERQGVRVGDRMDLTPLQDIVAER
ncbi:hypothetical protein GCM10011352_33300 [Marinobacterium zhoushanense]|uniref:DUF192 domain-containing protein n=1 Tax=Marinobacterium zhoushanense TaxID=1679163 RepID=A0ABQ1KRK0_9GAMM|nr:DUF192 domain-containing protein [Marinobacterium zhoushanense]GGC04441.1 hypothetical protein GCM10011352_33300 [Marinobacterium zhoushanense]